MSKEKFKIPFTKMHGLGNDYIYINCFSGLDIKSPESLSRLLSDRHTGIGGDGIVLILPSSIADAKMRMFNIDGSEGNMCGNAIRCVGKYLFDNGIAKKRVIKIETKSGVKQLELFVENDKVNLVKVDMGQAELEPKKIPTTLSGKNIINKKIRLAGNEYAITCVSMGNPHAVIFVDSVEKFDVAGIGRKIETDTIFPERVNTEFIEILCRNHLKMRVWERGSGETQACGTGACAAAVAAVLNGYCDKNADIVVQLPGGDLTIKYTDSTVYMTGTAVKVFDGMVEV